LNPQMLAEARAAADAVARQLGAHEDTYARLGAALRAAPPASVVTVARGSSDHAASYLAYLTMSRLGRLVTSLPMSLVTLYKSPLAAKGAFVVSISQSGQSPDLIEPIRYFREGGAMTATIVNVVDSPLARAAEWVLPLEAGTESSVAATKSYIASLVAGARLVAHWQQDQTLLRALAALPEQLQEARDAGWDSAVNAFAQHDRVMVIGRGISHPIAQEAALKFKETSAIQAEAFSSAEILHGPMALIEEGYPLLVLATRGPALEGLVQRAADMRSRGASVVLAAPASVAERDLTIPDAGHPDLDPILAIQAFYVLAAKLAVARGFDPDRPRHLNKVTKTH
jgi:glucosamine--fructose-6-phosphate aminotransferase (isomerizing)